MDIAKFKKSGETLDYTATTAVACGAVKVVAGCVCIALWDIAAGETGSLKVLHKAEVVTVTTDTAIGATEAGVAIYVTSAGAITKTEGSNTLVGYTAAAVGATDKSFDVICD